jgi:hypothetical protein
MLADAGELGRRCVAGSRIAAGFDARGRLVEPLLTGLIREGRAAA